jgi:hypothetical protein
MTPPAFCGKIFFMTSRTAIWALAGCGKTLRNCHSERSPVPYGAGRSEESGPVHFQEDTQSEILRCAQDDTREEFFRNLLEDEQ